MSIPAFIVALALAQTQTPGPTGTGALGTAGTDAADAADSGLAAANTVPDMTLWQYVKDGGLLSYVLIGLSIVAVTIVIRNILALRKEREAPPEIVEKLETLLRDNQLKKAEQFCANADNQCLITRVFRRALARCNASPFGTMELRTAVEEAGVPEVDRLHRMNESLGILAAIGPMLGLLGTVIGMIGAFRTIGTLTGTARSNQLATFMSMALVNTAEGLLVAIPCTIAFALFRRKIEVLTHEVADVLEALVRAVPSAAPRAMIAPPAPRPMNVPFPVAQPPTVGAPR